MKHVNIVAAIDLDDDLAEAVLLAADRLAKHDGARLHVVSAWPSLAARTGGYVSEFAPVSAATLSQGAIEADREAREHLETQLADFARQRASVAVAKVIEGEPAAAISEYARDIDADLIVTGSHQRGFWRSLLHGAGSRELVLDAPCGVFLVTKPYAEKQRKSRGG
jgi:nucleotide-binding universal stress UspA family protein